MRIQNRRKNDRQAPSNEGGGAPDWTVTYGDLMSLLLTFFILIASFSSIQESGFKKASGSLKGALGVLKFHPAPIEPNPIIIKAIGGNKKSDDSEVDLENLVKYIDQDDFKNMVSIKIGEGEVLIRMDAPILFELGRAQLKQSVFKLLEKIGKLVRNWPNKTRIEGHTDDLPINTIEYPSNWELSAARSLSVIHFFEKVSFVDPKKIYYAGYGENKPLVPNTTAENRKKNRRVEIYLEKTDNPIDWYSEVESN
ncbi:OmpA family protein [candidate division KSB1 bacterium]|nr:OmpA family protein [candidate division KSB1 bacterium]